MPKSKENKLTWEGLVEVERSHVLDVRIRFICTVGKSAEDENTLSGSDCQPSDTSVESWVGISGLVVDENALLGKGVVAELTAVLVCNSNKTIESCKVEVSLVT